MIDLDDSGNTWRSHVSVKLVYRHGCRDSNVLILVMEQFLEDWLTV